VSAARCVGSADIGDIDLTERDAVAAPVHARCDSAQLAEAVRLHVRSTSGGTTMGAWYKDSKRIGYVATYSDEKEMRRDVERASKHGWVPQSTTSDGGHVNVGRTYAGAVLTGGLSLLFGGSRSKEKLTISFVRAPKPQPPIVVQPPAVIVQPPAQLPPQVIVQSPPQGAAPLGGAGQPPISIADELTKLADLRDREVISEQEFQRLRVQALTGAAAPRAALPPAALTVAEAAAQLRVAQSTLRLWIKRAGGTDGCVVEPQGPSYPQMYITLSDGETYVTFGPVDR
jgi:hypothetical protein